MAWLPGTVVQSVVSIYATGNNPDLLQDSFDQTWVVRRVTSRSTPTIVMIQNKLPVFVARVTVAYIGLAVKTAYAVQYMISQNLTALL